MIFCGEFVPNGGFRQFGRYGCKRCSQVTCLKTSALRSRLKASIGALIMIFCCESVRNGGFRQFGQCGCKHCPEISQKSPNKCFNDDLLLWICFQRWLQQVCVVRLQTLLPGCVLANLGPQISKESAHVCVGNDLLRVTACNNTIEKPWRRNLGREKAFAEALMIVYYSDLCYEGGFQKC